jgi:hypothetical protein
MDAGDVLAWIDVRVVAVEVPLHPVTIGDDLAVELGVAGVLGQPGLGFGRGGAGQALTAMVDDQVDELVVAGDGFLGLDLGPEPGVRGA